MFLFSFEAFDHRSIPAASEGDGEDAKDLVGFFNAGMSILWLSENITG